MSPERRGYKISFDKVISNAKEIMLRDGHHVPALIVEGSKKDIITQIPNMPETHGEKIALLRFIGREAVTVGQIGQLQQVFIITEGWMSMGSKDNFQKIRPSNDPNRKEVLVISTMQINERKKYIKVFEVLRDNEQKVVGLEEFVSEYAKNNKSVKIPLVEAFVDGFRMAFRTRYN